MDRFPQFTWDLGRLEEGGVWKYLDDTATFVIPLHGDPLRPERSKHEST